MQNKICFIGVDLAPPRNEMLSRIVDDLTADLSDDQFMKISLQKKKDIPNSTNTITIRSVKYFSKIYQGIMLFIRLFSIRRNTNVETINFIWSGFGFVDDILISISQELGFKVVYTVVTDKQSEKESLKSCDKVIYFNLDHKENLLKVCDESSLVYLLPANKPSDEKATNSYSGDLLFVTAPFRKEDLGKRGVYDLISLMSLFERHKDEVQLTFINRWISGDGVIRDLIEKKGLSNINLVSETITDMDTVYKNHLCLINLDLNSGAPSIPMSMVEALSNETPICTTQKSWLSKMIEDTKAGILCKNDIEDLREAILAILRDHKKYSRNASQLSSKHFNQEVFIENYLDVLFNA